MENTGELSSFPARELERQGLLKYVPMNHCGVTSARDPQPYIGTNSLASCAGVAIYDRDRQVGGVAHVFFIEKTPHTWVDYMYDSQGRAIPNSGRMRQQIIDDPYWYRTFEHLSDDLFRRADAIGGKKYKFYGFKVKHGARTQRQNEQLEKFAEEYIKKCRGVLGKIENVEWRFEDGFILDTKTGLILPL